jgi:hypothetical protein
MSERRYAPKIDGWVLLTEHVEHPLGNPEAASDVDGADENGDRTQNGRRRGDWPRDLQHSAQNDDAADGVGDAHERGMKGRGNVPNHLPADETGQNKHDEVRQEGFRCADANANQGSSD